MKSKTLWIAVCVLALVLACPPSRAAREGGIVWITAQVAPLVDADYYAASHTELLQARRSIQCALYLAKYNAKYPKGFEAILLGDLIAAHNRGVDVSVILDGNDRPWENDGKEQEDKKNQSAFDFLTAAGVDVRYDSNDKLLHSKLIVIDESVTILGSTNWTYSALRKNHEASVIIRSPAVARTFMAGIRKIKMVAGGKEKR